MNIGLYLIFTAICFFIARPPLGIVHFLNTAVSGSLLGKTVPCWLRRIVTAKRMSKEETVAICFCGAAKTTGLGIPLVSAMWARFDDQTRAYIQIPVLLYTIEQVSYHPTIVALPVLPKPCCSH